MKDDAEAGRPDRGPWCVVSEARRSEQRVEEACGEMQTSAIDQGSTWKMSLLLISRWMMVAGRRRVGWSWWTSQGGTRGVHKSFSKASPSLRWSFDGSVDRRYDRPSQPQLAALALHTAHDARVGGRPLSLHVASRICIPSASSSAVWVMDDNDAQFPDGVARHALGWRHPGSMCRSRPPRRTCDCENERSSCDELMGDPPHVQGLVQRNG